MFISRLEKIWIFGMLVVTFVCYSVLIYHLLILKATIDFVLFYHSAKNFLLYQPIYMPIPWREYHFSEAVAASGHMDTFISGELARKFSANLNAPAHVLLTWPMGLFSYRCAYASWNILSFAAGAGGIYLLNKKLFSYLKNPLSFWICLSLFFASFFTFANTSLGQMGFISFLLIIGNWYLAGENKDRSAGILLGILLSFKLFFGLLVILFLLQRRWKLVVSAACVFVCANGLVYFLSDTTSFPTYWQIAHHVFWYDRNWNASWFGFVARLAERPTPDAFSMARWGWALYFIGIAPLFIIFWRLCRKKFVGAPEYDYAFCYTLIISLLISPLGWVYYFSILFLPAALLIRYFASLSQVDSKKIMLASFCIGMLLYPSTLDIEFKLQPVWRIWPDSANFIGLMMFFIFWLTHYKALVRTRGLAPVKNYWPWLMLSYLLTGSGIIFLVYIVFFRYPAAWA